MGMKNAAFGIRMHSGWGVVVCVSGDYAAPEIVERRRIVIVEPAMPGAKQPYHFAESLVFEEAEHHLRKCAEISQRLAWNAIGEMLDAVCARNNRVLGCAMLVASGRALPPLPKILASHNLVHTAEGEFFREAVRDAWRRRRVPVVDFRERELDGRAKAAFGKAAARVRQRISDFGKTVGSPWTQDEKIATLAGLLACGEFARSCPV